MNFGLDDGDASNALGVGPENRPPKGFALGCVVVSEEFTAFSGDVLRSGLSEEGCGVFTAPPNKGVAAFGSWLIDVPKPVKGLFDPAEGCDCPKENGAEVVADPNAMLDGERLRASPEPRVLMLFSVVAAVDPKLGPVGWACGVELVTPKENLGA